MAVIWKMMTDNASGGGGGGDVHGHKMDGGGDISSWYRGLKYPMEVQPQTITGRVILVCLWSINF